MRAGVLNRELHVYVTQSTGTVAQRGEESNSGIRAAAPPEVQGTAGCIVPARLFLETQLQTVAYSLTVQNGTVRKVKRSMPFGSGR
jgi:hypothetical protein